jgi:hypothetical protein
MLTDGTVIHKLGVAAPETDRDVPVREASIVKKFSVLFRADFFNVKCGFDISACFVHAMPMPIALLRMLSKN